jgi:hypothetical protein
LRHEVSLNLQDAKDGQSQPRKASKKQRQHQAEINRLVKMYPNFPQKLNREERWEWYQAKGREEGIPTKEAMRLYQYESL